MNSLPQQPSFDFDDLPGITNAKACRKCGAVKPFDEFHKRASRKDGMHPHCKECAISYSQKYFQEHKEQNHESHKQWRKRNAATRSEYMRKWRKANPDAVERNWQMWASAHDRSAYRRKYLSLNIERFRVINHKRRARKKNAGRFSLLEWKTLCARYSFLCLCCKKKKPLTVDHITPLVKGGTNDISNIQPLCHSCNSRKRMKTMDYR